MARTVLDREISRVVIVDDLIAARQSYELTVEDADLLPVPEEGPLPSLDAYVQQMRTRADAVLSDFKLTVKNYARFDGAELVARAYDAGVPGVLCTRYEKAQLDEIRVYRDRIPVLVQPHDLDTETLVRSIESAVHELDKGRPSSRKPWRTQVHVVEVDTADGFFYVDLPGWDSSEIIRLRLKDLAESIRLHIKEDFRCHAQVNIGADSSDDLFFVDWEES